MKLTDMNVKEEYNYFNKIAPVQTAHLECGDFAYRYYHNTNAENNVTIVVLAGGTGLADSFVLMARNIIKNYSFINFNYPLRYKTNVETADAIASLLTYLIVENVFLLGQSYGGLLAQIISKRHPSLIKGLILSSTASLSNNLKFEGMSCLVNMLSPEKELKNKKLYGRLPNSLLTFFMKFVFKKYLKNDKSITNKTSQMIDEIRDSLTGEYMSHMDGLLGDLRNHLGTHTTADFETLKGKILIIEPDDDKTFTDDIKEALFNLMPNPVIIRELSGGHLALMLDPEGFLEIVNQFIKKVMVNI